MRRVLLLLTVFAWFLTLGIENANACTCAGAGTPCESYGRAKAVFVGTVIGLRENRVSREVARKEDDWAPMIYKFSVEQSYLGVEGSEIEVFTGSGGGDCGYAFKNGQRYLVYAYPYLERLITSICTRTKPFSSANEDLAFLGNLSSAASGATIYGEVKLGPSTKDEPKPLDASVSLTIEGENERKEIRPDAQGRFRLGGLRPGKFKVKLDLPDTLTVFQPERELTIADRGCASVIYYLSENGRVSGRVIDENGQPVAKILVSLVAPDTSEPTNYVKLERTDEEGNYSFSGVPRGRYIIAINYNRFPDPNDSTNAYPRAFYPGVTDRPHAEVITVESGAKVMVHDTRLPARRPASIVDGQIVWADGTPVAGAGIIAKDVTYQESGLSYAVQADEQGRFRINGYIGQKLIIEGRINQAGVGAERTRITLARAVEPLKIVIAKR